MARDEAFGQVSRVRVALLMKLDNAERNTEAWKISLAGSREPELSQVNERILVTEVSNFSAH